MSTMATWEVVLAIAGLVVVTFVTRGFFVLSERELILPDWVRRGLRYAPLAALTAVVAPEILMGPQGWVDTWRDARLFGAAAGLGWYLWRRGLLGTILCGMAVFLPLRLGLGW